MSEVISRVISLTFSLVIVAGLEVWYLLRQLTASTPARKAKRRYTQSDGLAIGSVATMGTAQGSRSTDSLITKGSTGTGTGTGQDSVKSRPMPRAVSTGSVGSQTQKLTSASTSTAFSDSFLLTKIAVGALVAAGMIYVPLWITCPLILLVVVGKFIRENFAVADPLERLKASPFLKKDSLTQEDQIAPPASNEKTASALELIAKAKVIIAETKTEILTELDSVKQLNPSSVIFRFQPQQIPLNSHWKFSGIERGVLILSNSLVSNSVVSSLCKTVVPMTTGETFQVLRDVARFPEFDKMIQTVEIIEKIDDETFLLYFLYQGDKCKAQNARDFSVLFHATQTGEGKYIILMRSILTTKCPPTPRIERGEILPSGWLIEPQGVEACAVTFLAQVDPKKALANDALETSKQNPVQTVINLKYLQKRT